MLQKKLYPRYFLLITLAIYVIFYIAPGILGIAYSFTNYTIYTKKISFVGLQNYLLLFKQQRFLTGMNNTFLFTVLTTIFKNVVGFSLAIALNKKFKSRNALRAIFYLPVILSTLIVGVIFKAMLLPDTGLINQFLALFSDKLGHMNWLGSKDTAIYMVMLVDIWKGAGYCMVIYLAGLQVIPQECYEAAAIDGVSSWNEFWKITFPLMLSSVSINVLLCVIGGLKVFDIIIALTNGGPGMSTQVLNTTIYSYFGSGALSTGSAASVLLTILVVVFFWGIKRLFSRWEDSYI